MRRGKGIPKDDGSGVAGEKRIKTNLRNATIV